MMKSFLLLILSLMTACGDDHDVKGCSEGWVEFSCKHPERKGKYQNIRVVTPTDTTIQSKKNDMWEHQGNYSLYHDTKNKNLRVVIKQLDSKDFGKYKCKFHKDDSSEKVKLKNEMHDCQTTFSQTVYTTAKTNFTCDYSYNHSKGKKSRKKRSSGEKSGVYFFCKDTRGICEDILSTESLQRSNGRFTLTDIRRGFNVSISHVSSQDEGVYWCGVEANNGDRAARKKIHLKVQQPTTAPPPKPSHQPVTVTSTASTSSTQSTTAQTTAQITVSAKRQGGLWIPGFIIAVICVAVLVLIFVLVYKRYKVSKNTNVGAQNKKETDYGYAEIQENLQKPKTVYVTANFPTNHSAFAPYSEVQFQNGSGEDGGHTYSTMSDSSQHPTYSTVNHPSTVSEAPVYSTVNKPQ